MRKPYPIDDVIDDYQWKLEAIPTWTKEKRELMAALRKALREARFGYYYANNASCFSLTGLGKATVQTIPPNKRGRLRWWRGQTVRIVCIEPGRYKRGYAVGPTTRKPARID